jgi:hypothetical protein
MTPLWTVTPPSGDRASGSADCRAATSRFASSIFHVLPFSRSLPRPAWLRFRPLSRYPFADIPRAVCELVSVGFGYSQEFHCFADREKNVSEIDSHGPSFPFKRRPERIHVLRYKPPAYSQDHKPLCRNQPVDSAAHWLAPALSAFLDFRHARGLWPFLANSTNGHPFLCAIRQV